MATAEIMFDRNSAETYAYEIPKYLEVKPGDAVVVHLPGRGSGGGLGIGYVSAVVDGPGSGPSGAASPIVDLVNVAQYNGEMVKREKAAKIKAEMDRRCETVRRTKEYLEASMYDAPMRSLLEELRVLES